MRDCSTLQSPFFRTARRRIAFDLYDCYTVRHTRHKVDGQYTGINAKVPHLHGRIRDTICVFFTVRKNCIYSRSKHVRNTCIPYTYSRYFILY
ncbi:hypothetical protein PUN28_007570 [Cardiocondyla obscurior]|uniref:Uncharacterized protein n=1 Tax=Cardiocondyla obscurior TaxID=286306 RepID=A0AAW2G9W6_9HYME